MAAVEHTPAPLASRLGLARRGLPLALLLAAAFAVALAARAFVGLDAPLWLDETWTGAFAAQPTLADLTHQVRDDANAPAYYDFMFVWSRLFGVSNLALRAPSILFGAAAALTAWFGLRRHAPSQALLWSALLALWVPGLELSGYARCYALLLLCATLNTLAFVEALRRPDLKRTSLWVATATLAVLVHYHAAFLALSQAAVFVVAHRAKVLRLWPSALAAAPGLAWIGYHAPRLAEFSRPEVAWYDLFTLAELPAAAGFLVGAPVALLVSAVALLAAHLLGRRPAEDAPAAGAWGPLHMAGVAAVLAAAACLAFASLRPSFTIRYLTAFAPGVLLLVAAETQRASRGRREAEALLLAGFTGLALLWISQASGRGRPYNFEAASEYLAQARPDRLAFFWDHPATRVEAPSQLDAVGGFFLRRAGHPVTVAPLKPAPGDDVSTSALRAAGPDGAVLWLYDLSVRGTSARRVPPRIAAQDPSFECRDFGVGGLGVVACRKRSPR